MLPTTPQSRSSGRSWNRTKYVVLIRRNRFTKPSSPVSGPGGNRTQSPFRLKVCYAAITPRGRKLLAARFTLLDMVVFSLVQWESQESNLPPHRYQRCFRYQRSAPIKSGASESNRNPVAAAAVLPSAPPPNYVTLLRSSFKTRRAGGFIPPGQARRLAV